MKTYAERRQDALFALSREYWRIASDVLKDDIAVAETTTPSLRSLEWARDVAKRHAEKAREYEGLAHEECVASNAREAFLVRIHDAYGRVVTDHIKLWDRLYPGTRIIREEY